jgi:hypothetical protein
VLREPQPAAVALPSVCQMCARQLARSDALVPTVRLPPGAAGFRMPNAAAARHNKS